MCYMRVYLGYFFYPAGIWLIALLTSTKLLLLQCPAKSGNLTKKVAHRVCSLTLIPSLTFPLLFLIVDKDNVEFDYSTYNCDYGFESRIWKKFLTAAMTIFVIFVPNVLIIATTIPTLMYLADARKSARRVQGSVRWQGAVAVALTAVVYCVSTLPTVVDYIGRSFVTEGSTSPLPLEFARIAKFLIMINIMANFFIYTLTIKTFRRFLFSKITSVLPLPVARNMMSPGECNLAVVFRGGIRYNIIPRSEPPENSENVIVKERPIKVILKVHIEISQ